MNRAFLVQLGLKDYPSKGPVRGKKQLFIKNLFIIILGAEFLPGMVVSKKVETNCG